MKLLFEVDVCEYADPKDVGEFISELIADLDGECEVKVLFRGVLNEVN